MKTLDDLQLLEIEDLEVQELKIQGAGFIFIPLIPVILSIIIASCIDRYLQR